MPIDKAPALEALQVGEELLDELLTDFVNLAGDEIGSIRAALDAPISAGLDRHAHNLAGMAANLRLERCRDRAAELEAALLSRDPIRSANALALMEQAVDEVRDSVGSD